MLATVLSPYVRPPWKEVEMNATLVLLYLMIGPRIDLLDTPPVNVAEIRGPFFADRPVYYDIPPRGFSFRR